MKNILFYMLIACTACKSSSSVEYDDVYIKTESSNSSKSPKAPQDSKQREKDQGWKPFNYIDHIVWTQASDPELRSLYLATHTEIRLSCLAINRQASVNKRILREEDQNMSFLKIPAGTIGKVLDIKYDKYGPSEFYLFFDKKNVIYKIWFKSGADNLFYVRDPKMKTGNVEWYITTIDKGQSYLDVYDQLKINTTTEEGVASGGY